MFSDNYNTEYIMIRGVGRKWKWRRKRMRKDGDDLDLCELAQTINQNSMHGYEVVTTIDGGKAGVLMRKIKDVT